MNVVSRKIVYLFATFSILSLWIVPSARSYDDVLEARMSTIWVEGQLLGDMVLGARSQLILLYMDRRACEVAEKERGQLPEWITWNLQYKGNASKDKQGLFLLRYKALKNWDFDISRISINGYSLTEGDVLTKSEFVKSGLLSSGTEGTLAVVVPLSYLKPGKKVSVSYGDWSDQWTIPKR